MDSGTLYYWSMLIDGFPFESVWRKIRGSSPVTDGMIAFVQFIERKLGTRMVLDARQFPYELDALAAVAPIIDALQSAGIIASYAPVHPLPDEPRFEMWNAVCSDATKHVTGGIAVYKDATGALIPALAEALERSIWLEKSDFYTDVRIRTVAQIAAEGHAILPERFAGFSEKQRSSDRRLTLPPESEYVWIRGYSWAEGKSVHIPAQIIQPLRAHPEYKARIEPIIRTPITTGLATHSTRAAALLSGALEVIERDAFMIMWMNQLSLPKIDASELCIARSSLAGLAASCEKYGFRPHFVRLITDAPAYAVCAVVEDTRSNAVAYSLGLKADQDIAHAAEGALLEALRAGHSARVRIRRGEKMEKTGREIQHTDRLLYWADPSRASKLAFLVAGATAPMPHERWDTYTTEQQWHEIVAWCRSCNYELASVPLSTRENTPLPWHVEMVVVPELQPMHQDERYACLGGRRLRSIPDMHGYRPRESAYDTEPHPFA